MPVERVAIVGTGLKTVEQVAGRLTTGQAALAGAGQGAMIGLFFGLLFGLFFTVAQDFFDVVLYGIVAGAIFGSIFGAIGQAATGRPARLRLGHGDDRRALRASGRPRGLCSGEAAAGRAPGRLTR